MLVYWRVTIIDRTSQPAPDLMILQVSSLGIRSIWSFKMKPPSHPTPSDQIPSPKDEFSSLCQGWYNNNELG